MARAVPGNAIQGRGNKGGSCVSRTKSGSTPTVEEELVEEENREKKGGGLPDRRVATWLIGGSSLENPAGIQFSKAQSSEKRTKQNKS